ncbi:MAG: DNA helicase RecQ [Firmicutes bacterium]|nr:DNA helicase RecQ [Bacillota bacterium]
MDRKEYLKEYFGYTEFRKGQEEIIEKVLSGRDVCAIMPTGAGKSLCFQLPALMMDGVTLVVSPLISLMKDQVESLRQMGIRACFVNSSLQDAEISRIYEAVANNECRILYVAPERLSNDEFLMVAQSVNIPFVVVDEAHCVSQWGQDFRPDYLRIAEFVRILEKRPVMGVFTATATERVRRDIVDKLELRNPYVLVTGFDRENLYFETKNLTPKKKYEELIKYLSTKRGRTGIIYCSTRKTVDQLTERLCRMGFNAAAYHAGMEDADRRKNQEDFIYDRVNIIVATNAFGMGIDKSDVSFVLHFNMPKDLESYYQEAGRAGRDGEKADCIMYYSGSDVRLIKYFIEGDKEYYFGITEEKKQEVKRQEYQRLDKILNYCKYEGCKRHFILDYFGEFSGNYCGNCSNCRGLGRMKDVSVEAQKIVSCMWRGEWLGMDFSKDVLVDILKGEETEAIVKSGVRSMKTFGAMADDDREYIGEIADFLAKEGFISKNREEVFYLNENSGRVVFDKIAVKMPFKDEKTDIIEKKDVHSEELFEKLRMKRQEIARDESVPAFVIFSDATLRDMSEKKPVNSFEFLNVSGVGQHKLKKYGNEFISVVRDFVGYEEKETEESTIIGTSQGKERISNRQGEKWTKAEDEWLRKEYSSGMSVAEIARAHKRTREAIRSRLKKTGLIEEIASNPIESSEIRNKVEYKYVEAQPYHYEKGTKQRIISEYKKGKSIEKIAKMFGMPKETVRNKLGRWGYLFYSYYGDDE